MSQRKEYFFIENFLIVSKKLKLKNIYNLFDYIFSILISLKRFKQQNFILHFFMYFHIYDILLAD